MIKILFVIIAFAMCSAYADDCANGYTWNSANGQCEITCNPGYYVATVGGTCVPFPAGASYYIDTSHTVAYGNITPASVIKECPCMDDKCGWIPEAYGNGDNNSINYCIINRCGLRYVTDSDKVNDIDVLLHNISTHGIECAPCYYGGPTSNQLGTPIFNRCVGGSTIESCDGGFYTDTVYIGNGMWAHPCNPVGVDYYSPDGDLDRYPCPDGTISGGFGEDADDISDCVPYKTLHVAGTDPIQMSTVPRSEHRLVVSLNGVNYYGKTTTKFINNKLHFNLGETVYTVINPLDEFDYYNNVEYSFYVVP